MSSAPVETTSWESYKRLLGYTRKHWKIFLFAVFGFILNAQTEWAAAQLLKYIITAIQDQDQASKNMFPVLIITLFLVRGIGSFIGTYYMSLISRNIVYALRIELFDRLMTLPARYYNENSAGHISAKLMYNVEQVTAAATDALKTIVREGAVVIGLFGYLFYTNWKLSLSLLVVGPFAAMLVRVASKRFRKLAVRMQNAMGNLNHIAQEAINGFLVVKTYGGEDFERNRFDKASRENLKQGMKIVVTSAINTPVIQLLMAVALAGVIWVALQPGITGQTSPGEFVAYITAAGLMAKPIKSLTEVNEKLQRGISAAQSIFDVIDETPEPTGGTRAITRLKGEVEFRNLRFAYEPGNPVLHDFSLKVAPGQTVAIVGRSGSGKTTLVNLLPRFHDAEAGELLIDGFPIDDYPVGELRKQIATVSQKVILFDDTVANNIAYGAYRHLPRETIVAAAKTAFADDFIRELPQGYDTRIGQDGMQLSGGQRQRLAIARALIKDAPILILDEATSALDNESEFYIQAALERVMEGRTTLVIAHRLSTIENADVIVVMDQGRIIEQGNHAELLAKAGVYAQLHSRHFSEDDDGRMA
ncbi:lipid A export permease/ATP-binding protein MsbA [Paraperlucidibaca sp.]|jgi:subfamily B ATP-binding cassette protein MsbA|uniref:lipid A export permease/ATP-binding protein MsbA n=1 Tax=Paraperlucidibaca sp. TaxID=2708021 RepID=UPI003988E3F4